MSKLTANEVMDSMTGFEEIAIEKVTGYGIDAMAEQGRSLRLIRAAATILEARKVAGEGAVLSEKEVRAAHLKIQAMPRSELAEVFEVEEDEPFEDEPVTDQGKDDSEHERTPSSSPTSASGQD